MTRLLLLALLSAGTAHSRGAHPEAGLVPRAVALGSACGLCRGSAEALWYNPAGLRGTKIELQAVTGSWLEGLYYNGGQGMLGGSNYGIGIGGKSFKIEDMGRDSLGRPTQAFSYSEMETAFGAGGGSDALAAGMAIRQRFLEWGAKQSDEQPLAIDGGLQGSFPNPLWSWGLGFRGLGFVPNSGGGMGGCIMFCFQGPSLIVPLTRFSLGYGSQDKKWLWMGELQADASRNRNDWMGGVEHNLDLGFGRRSSFRLGWRSDQWALGSLGGLSSGLGLIWSNLVFDYAVVLLGDFGQSHQASVAYRFESILGPH